MPYPNPLFFFKLILDTLTMPESIGPIVLAIRTNLLLPALAGPGMSTNTHSKIAHVHFFIYDLLSVVMLFVEI